MDTMKPTVMDETDAATMLGALAGRLLADAMTLRGIALDRGDAPESAEGRVAHAIAGGIEDVARRLDLVREHLCDRCQLLDVVETVSVGRLEERAAAEPAKGGRRRKPK